MGKPPRDALIFRQVADDVWGVKVVSMVRLAAFTEAGWIVLITSDSLRDLEPPRPAPPKRR